MSETALGYQGDFNGSKDNGLLSSAVVGDRGASWRLKALKRAQEQAAHEGRKLQEVVEERWGSMGHFAASIASHTVAPTHAHLQAIKIRRKGFSTEQRRSITEHEKTEMDFNRKSSKEFHPWNPKIRMPENIDSSDDLASSSALKGKAELETIGSASGETREDSTMKPAMSANQLAAKALQLRIKGKHNEAEKLLKEAENIKEKQSINNESSGQQINGTTSRFIMHDVSARQRKREDDGDLYLAQKIIHNADEEYEYEDGPRRKTRKKGDGGNNKSSEITNHANRFLTQQERCQFCFENPKLPKHLVIAIANFTYLSLPQQQPVVPGHCGIFTLQHESATRTVDDDVWNEIRNFKKCLIMMFAKQEKDVVFIETVMGLVQQRRHCMVECIPLPQGVAKQWPAYFKKAIDEAEDEWSQNNAKKLIDTSVKGLRNSIPRNFPYVHVEFRLSQGFVHVIEDEKQFKSDFGLNVIRSMLRSPVEDMHRRIRHGSIEAQKQSVASFARGWEPFDWTKQLD